MDPLGKPQVLQFAAKDIVRRNLFHVRVHVETEKDGHISSHGDGGLPLFNGSQRGMTHASSFTHHGGRYPPPYASKLQVLTQNHQRFPGFGHQQCLSRSHESLLRLKSISYILAFIVV
jgi:hypothetical protein